MGVLCKFSKNGTEKKDLAAESKKRYRDAKLPKLYVMNKKKEEMIESTTMIKIINHWKKIMLLRKEIKACIAMSPEGIFARWLLQENGYDKECEETRLNSIYTEAWDVSLDNKILSFKTNKIYVLMYFSICRKKQKLLSTISI